MANYPDFPLSVQKSIRTAIVPIIQAIPTGTGEEAEGEDQLEQLSQLNIVLLDNYEGADTLSLRILQVLASDKGKLVHVFGLNTRVADLPLQENCLQW